MMRKLYWQLRGALHRRLHPTDTVLSPHDWADAVARHLPESARRDRVVVVDGGAHDGAWACAFAHRMIAGPCAAAAVEVHAFEPNTDLWPRLERNLAGIPGGRYAMALAERSGAATMHINASPMTSSMLPRGEFAQRYFDEVTRLAEGREVPTVTLDDWFDRSGLDRVDVLKLDLQGFEAQALRGAARLLRRGVGCVFTEVSFVELYRGQAQFGEIDSLMRSMGYRLYNLYHLATKNRDGQLNGADALYIPDARAAAGPALRLCTGDAA